jgi:hypothetical protein
LPARKCALARCACNRDRRDAVSEASFRMFFKMSRLFLSRGVRETYLGILRRRAAEENPQSAKKKGTLSSPKKEKNTKKKEKRHKKKEKK